VCVTRQPTLGICRSPDGGVGGLGGWSRPAGGNRHQFVAACYALPGALWRQKRPRISGGGRAAGCRQCPGVAASQSRVSRGRASSRQTGLSLKYFCTSKARRVDKQVSLSSTFVPVKQANWCGIESRVRAHQYSSSVCARYRACGRADLCEGLAHIWASHICAGFAADLHTRGGVPRRTNFRRHGGSWCCRCCRCCRCSNPLS
jgi:hypothetical protein